jgi:hypothetical protein
MDFKQAEKRFEQLKVRFAAGTLSEDEFKAQLKDLMLQDEQGGWWMIGYETEQWYRHDGKDWVRTDPPSNLSQISTQKNIKEEVGTNTPRTKSDEQTSFWKLGKKEVIQSVIGLCVFTLLYFLFGRNSISSPAFAAPLFFGLVFGPLVGAIVGAGGYIIFSVHIYYHLGYNTSVPFFNYFSNINLFAYAVEGFIMGFANAPSKNYRSLNSILRVELFIILAILARVLFSVNLGMLFSGYGSTLWLQENILYPLLGSLIIVPISMIAYSFILSRRKTRT